MSHAIKNQLRPHPARKNEMRLVSVVLCLLFGGCRCIQLLDNGFCQPVVNLIMARHRLGGFGNRVGIPIVVSFGHDEFFNFSNVGHVTGFQIHKQGLEVADQFFLRHALRGVIGVFI